MGDDVIRSDIDLPVAGVSDGDSLGQFPGNQNGFRRSIATNGGVFERDAGEIVSRFGDGEFGAHVRNRFVGGVSGEMGGDFIFSDIGLSVSFVGNGDAVWKSSFNRKRFLGPVISERFVGEGHARHVIDEFHGRFFRGLGNRVADFNGGFRRISDRQAGFRGRGG